MEQEKVDIEAFESRHEVIANQLEHIERWIEDLPLTNVADRQSVMIQIVDFMQRYVLVDAAWEEQHVFPRVGDRAVVLIAEHRYFARWVKELGAFARGPGHADAVYFRRTAYKLIGLLEAHMHAEEALIAPLFAERATTAQAAN